MATTTDDQTVTNYLRAALIRNQGLAERMKPLASVAVAIAKERRGRTGILKLIQVVQMDPHSPDCSLRPMVRRIEDALGKAEVLGLPDGIEAHRIVAAAALAAGGGVLGCPTWEPRLLRELPTLEPVLVAAGAQLPPWPTKEPGPWKSVVAALQTPKDEWRDPLAKVVPVIESVILKSIAELNSSSATFVDELIVAAQSRVQVLEHHLWETNTLWWAQALFSPSRGVPYRELDESERLLCMADDLAEAGPPYGHRGLESFFVETLRRCGLGFNVDDDQTADQWSATLLRIPSALNVPDDLKTLVAEDAAGLPVSFVLASHGQEKERVMKGFRQRVLLSDDRLSLGAWAVQLLRERQLVRWLSEKGS